MAHRPITCYFRPLGDSVGKPVPTPASGLATVYDLPPELIGLILRNLENADICSFRSTCRHIEALSLEHFTEVIQRRSFFYAPHSMSTLLDMAHDRRLGPRVKVLRLSTLFFDTRSILSPRRDELEDYAAIFDDYDAFQCIQDSAHWIQKYDKKQAAWMKSDAVSMLSAIVAALPNLYTVEVGGDKLDDESSSCYGTQRILENCKHGRDSSHLRVFLRYTSPTKSEIGLTCITSAILRALSLSRKSIHCLRAQTSTHPYIFEEEEVSNIVLERISPLESYHKQGLARAFRQLKELKLAVTWGNNMDSPLTQRAKRWLPNILSLAPQLEHLGITEDMYFIRGYRTAVGFTALAEKAHMPRLAKLELEKIIVASKDLLLILDNHSKTLREVSFGFMALADARWHSFLSTELARVTRLSATIRLNCLHEIVPFSGLWKERTEHRVFMTTSGLEECRNCFWDESVGECEHMCTTIASEALATLEPFTTMDCNDFEAHRYARFGNDRCASGIFA